MTRTHCLLALALGHLLAGCVTSVHEPLALDLRAADEPWPSLAATAETKLLRAPDDMKAFEPPVALAVAWLHHEEGSYREESLAEYTRAQLLGELRDQMSAPPFGPVTALPLGPSSGAPDSPTLRAARASAAKAGAPLLVVVQTRSWVRHHDNALSTLYAIDVTRELVPGESLVVQVAAEACVIEATEGVLLGCRHGRGEAQRPFGRTPSRGKAVRALRERALRTALWGVVHEALDMAYLHTVDTERSALPAAPGPGALD